MRRVTSLVCGLLAPTVAALLGAVDSRSGEETAAPADRFVADLQRRLLGPALQPADEDQRGNVSALSLAWIVPHERRTQPAAAIKSTPLQINGVLYVTTPDHVWAIDARTGREIWHYVWQSKGGNHLGNRGVAVLGDSLYFETPDCNLVALNIKDGTERWHKPICDLDQFYYGSVAPVVVKNHVIAGVSGDDLDIPGYLEAHDPVTGELQWRWYGAAEEGGPGIGDLAERRRREARRRHDLAAGHVRSRT